MEQFWIWIIILIIIALAKGVEKLKSLAERKPPSSPAPSRRPRPVAASPRPVQMPPPIRSRTVVQPQSPPAGWQVNTEELRRFIRQVAGQAEPPPLPAPPQPRRMTPPPEPPPPPLPPPPAPTAAAAKRSRRATAWAAALRDKQNLRNVIVAAEIIGRPKGI
jgi:hypothetical protein